MSVKIGSSDSKKELQSVCSTYISFAFAWVIGCGATFFFLILIKEVLIAFYTMLIELIILTDEGILKRIRFTDQRIEKKQHI